MKDIEIPKKDGETADRRDRGFSLLEALIALAITVVILGVGLMIIKSMMDSNVSATSVYEVNTDNQAALNIIRRDLQKVGRFQNILPQAGIPLPAGAIGEADAWKNNRCFDASGNKTNGNCANPAGNDMLLLKGTYNEDNLRGFADTDYVLDVVTPGIVNGHDAVSILYIDDSAQIGADGLVQIGAGGYAQVGIDAQLSGGTLKSSATNGFKALRQGDFIYLANSNILQYVRDVVNGYTVTISDGPGTSASDTSDGAETVYLLRRVTYYMESAPSEASPAWLMRQVNLNESPARVVSGITSFKLTYDILDTSTGTNGVLEVDISPDVTGAWVTGDSYSNYSASTIKIDDLETRDKDFFNKYPYRTLNIVRVNVNVLSESDIAGQGNKNTVKIDQTARIAVRGFLAPGSPPDPCLLDPASCDPCVADPASCDPCVADPASCDPCLLDPGAPGCRNVINAGCAVNSSKKGVLCNTPCAVNDSVGGSNACEVYYYKVDDSNYDCTDNWEDASWLKVPENGSPHSQNNSEKGYDTGVATEVKNFPQSGYYCLRIQNFVRQPGKVYISEQPFNVQ